MTHDAVAQRAVRRLPALVPLVFAALAALHLYPVSLAPARWAQHWNADTQQWEWTMAWIAHAIVRAPLQLFNGNIFAPERGVLAYSDPMIAPAGSRFRRPTGRAVERSRDIARCHVQSAS